MKSNFTFWGLIHQEMALALLMILSVRAIVDLRPVARLQLLVPPESRSRYVPTAVSCVVDPMPSDTTQLYATMDRLLRRAKRSPSVRALSSKKLTMPPEEV